MENLCNNSWILLGISLSLVLFLSVLVSVVEGDLKVSFSIATTLRCRGGCYSFPWIAPLTLDLYLIMLSVKQWGIRYHFFFFCMTRPEIDPQLRILKSLCQWNLAKTFANIDERMKIIMHYEVLYIPGKCNMD